MGLTDVSNLQVNYRNPQYVDGRLFYIREQQMDVEYLIQDAHNWTLVSRTKSSRIVEGEWSPVKTTVSFSNVDDPAKFTAQYIVTWSEILPRSQPDVNLEAVYAASIALGLVPGLFFRELIQASIAALWTGITTWAEDIWTFQWTPGMGDGQAAALFSFERVVQQYVDMLVEKGYISYK